MKYPPVALLARTTCLLKPSQTPEEGGSRSLLRDLTSPQLSSDRSENFHRIIKRQHNTSEKQQPTNSIAQVIQLEIAEAWSMLLLLPSVLFTQCPQHACAVNQPRSHVATVQRGRDTRKESGAPAPHLHSAAVGRTGGQHGALLLSRLTGLLGSRCPLLVPLPQLHPGCFHCRCNRHRTAQEGVLS